jgi:hypothetical protein
MLYNLLVQGNALNCINQTDNLYLYIDNIDRTLQQLKKVLHFSFRGDLRYQRDSINFSFKDRLGFWAEKTPFLPQISRIRAEDSVNQFRGDCVVIGILKNFLYKIDADFGQKNSFSPADFADLRRRLSESIPR